MKKFDHLKNIKTLLNQQLKKHGFKLPKNAELKDITILSDIMAGKITEIDLAFAITKIESRSDKACVAASKVAERESK
jgi:hypothetical protein